MGIRKTAFGDIDGQAVEAYEIENGSLRASIITYGAALSQMHVPDRTGRVEDIVLGYDDLESYLRYRGSAGATCGRYANRIGNAQATIDGQTYSLSANEPPNHLHGGFRGFSKRIWSAEQDIAGRAVRLTLKRPDGDEGYPGTLAATVTYSLADETTLEIVMEATTDRPTVVNLVHHGYWNLAGHGAGNIHEQHLVIDAERYTPTDTANIPTGELAPVAGTVFDFRTARPIGSAINDTAHLPEGGYNHNFCLNGGGGALRRAARAVDPRSGRGLEIWTDQPGVQFYTANHFARLPAVGKGGAAYGKHAGFALETQNYPNAPNVPHFPSAVLRPGEVYRHAMRIPFFTVES